MTSPNLHGLSDALGSQYAIHHEIGRGGMGIVVAARDLKLDRPVALKFLPAHLASDPDVRERFLREARTAAALSHPNIVPIYRADELSGVVFFAMALVNGSSVAQHLRDHGPMEPRAAIRLLADVATALGYAHARGVVHRDIKAENILIDPEHGERAVVSDFGIARVATASSKTATGTALGTVYYMSPEQIVGGDVDGRCDLYSLGVLGFFALSGRFPFDSETATAILVAHVTTPAPQLRSIAPYVPGTLASIIDRLLDKDPTQRYQSAAALGDALDKAMRELPTGALPHVAHLSSMDAQQVWSRAAAIESATDPARVPPAKPRAIQPQANPLTDGYSVSQVRESAREAGLQTAAVDRALVELSGVATPHALSVRTAHSAKSFASRVIGRPAELVLELEFEGELTSDGLAEVAEALGSGGTISGVGQMVAWQSSTVDTMSGKMHRSEVRVVSRRGRTLVTASEDLSDTVNGVFWGVGGGVGGAAGGIALGQLAGAMHQPLVGVPVALALLGTALAGARAGARMMVASREEKLKERLEVVGKRVAELLSAK